MEIKIECLPWSFLVDGVKDCSMELLRKYNIDYCTGALW
jgi:hypothetical protein